MLEDATNSYVLGTQGVPTVRAIAKCRVGPMIDSVLGKDIAVLVVPDEAQLVDLIVGHTFPELPYVPHARLGGSLRFWHKNECLFSHLVPLVTCPKVRWHTAEKATPPANVVNWVRLSPQSNNNSTVMFDHFRHEIIDDMTGRDVTVSVLASGEQDLVLCKGERV
ncbi:hypothetical protein HPB51_014889 [Rhipicephalus microplus]|uniref:Uncharacterized protein n=1 Tax=Rhipicephalus microplus TaxID=6941 RepID=A0A9J6ET74_RHIMP|nr:hypothetical protein HPB51_014889 [Rhipicephalus microplus]